MCVYVRCVSNSLLIGRVGAKKGNWISGGEEGRQGRVHRGRTVNTTREMTKRNVKIVNLD